MNVISHRVSPGGPFSAVRPYFDGSDAAPVSDESPSAPDDSFIGSPFGGPYLSPSDSSKSAASPSGLAGSAASSATRTALAAFPQVVHLLADPELTLGGRLSEQLGLPLITLNDETQADLATELSKPEYADGFILEGFPKDSRQTEELDGLLGNVAPESHRVLGWELSDNEHQEVLDHYLDRDLLWMVPSSEGVSDPAQAEAGILSCLEGLPVLQ